MKPSELRNIGRNLESLLLTEVIAFLLIIQTPVEKDEWISAIVKRGNIIYFAYLFFPCTKEHGMKAYKLVDNSLKLLLKDKIEEDQCPTTGTYQHKLSTSL